MTTSTQHDTWSIERRYPVSPARVFAAWADPDVKRRWFVGPDSLANENLTSDLRIGGRETTSGTTPDGNTFAYDARTATSCTTSGSSRPTT